jgi:hypothetical protein
MSIKTFGCLYSSLVISAIVLCKVKLVQELNVVTQMALSMFICFDHVVS